MSRRKKKQKKQEPRALLICSSVLMVFILVFLGIASQPLEGEGGQMSAVGLTVSVPANPLNTMLVQLRERAAELTVRENALRAREQASTQSKTGLDPLALGAISLATFIGFMFLMHLYHDRNRLQAE